MAALLSLFFSVALVSTPVYLSSCGGENATKASKKKPSSKRGSGSDDELADARKGAKSARTKVRKSAPKLLASDWKKAEKLYASAQKAEDAGKESSAAKKYRSARKAFRSLRRKLADAKKERGEIDKILDKVKELEEKARGVSADKLAQDVFNDAAALLASAQNLMREGDANSLATAKDELDEASTLFAEAVDTASDAERDKAEALAEAKLAAEDKAKAKELGADQKAVNDWREGERLERTAKQHLADANFTGAIAAFQRASSQYQRAISTVEMADRAAEQQALSEKERKKYEEQLAQRRKEEAERQLQLAAQRKRDTSVSPSTPIVIGGGVKDHHTVMAGTAMSKAAEEFNAERFTQTLAPEDEEFLRAHYRKLSPQLFYDPETGVALLDYEDGAAMQKDLHKQVNTLRKKRFISFINPMTYDPDDAESGRASSFQANTQGMFLIRVPFKYHVRVDFRMSIQTMDASGLFHTLVMFDPKKKNHYLTKWLAVGVSPRGRSPRWSSYPDPEFSRSANYWFDKTRDVPMIIKYSTPIEDTDGTETPEELAEFGEFSCTYDVGLDEKKNTYETDSAFGTGGFVGFKWSRTKYTVKKLKIVGILDKEMAVQILKKKVKAPKKKKKKKKRRRKRKKKPTDGGVTETAKGTQAPNKGDDFGF